MRMEIKESNCRPYNGGGRSAKDNCEGFFMDASDTKLFCQTGKRSLQAAQMLLKDGAKDKKVYSLKDGILSLQD